MQMETIALTSLWIRCMREARGEGGKAVQGAREARRGTTAEVVPPPPRDRKRIPPLPAAFRIIGPRLILDYHLAVMAQHGQGTSGRWLAGGLVIIGLVAAVVGVKFRTLAPRPSRPSPPPSQQPTTMPAPAPG